MKTWKKEMLVVSSLLLLVNFLTHKLFTIEILAAIAVILTFGHFQISTRLSEKESLKLNPDVSCYNKLLFYTVGKEMLWFVYFLMNKSYSALVGVLIFLLYPVWRRWRRR